MLVELHMTKVLLVLPAPDREVLDVASAQAPGQGEVNVGIGKSLERGQDPGWIFNLR